MKLPILVVFFFIIIIVSFFSSIKQKEVTCIKKTSFSNLSLEENIVSKIDGKKIRSMDITKSFSFTELPNRYDMDMIIDKLNNSLDYLKDKVKYTISEDKIIINIHVDRNEVVLLDNISFDGKGIVVLTNTKSSEVLTLAVSDNYTEREYKKRLKQKGFRCK